MDLLKKYVDETPKTVSKAASLTSRTPGGFLSPHSQVYTVAIKSGRLLENSLSLCAINLRSMYVYLFELKCDSDYLNLLTKFNQYTPKEVLIPNSFHNNFNKNIIDVIKKNYPNVPVYLIKCKNFDYIKGL
ncbi:hypothetical protein A3Q56_02550, partial [Intoshia linei]